MHALSWIAKHGRYLRQIGASSLRRSLDRPKRHCTWCGRPVGKGRSTWCSDACVWAFRVRCWPSTVRRLVEERDQGVCSSCGLDTNWIASLRWRTWGDGVVAVRRGWPGRVNRRGRRNQRRRDRGRLILQEMRRRGYPMNRSAALWEADHILPVVEGGGLCGLENYRTLCVVCHKAESAALAGRRAGGRRASDRQTTLEASWT